jgi:histidine triad (HIT) family protein
LSDCVFCRIVAGTDPATMVAWWPDAVAFLPLNPVVVGHTLVIPRAHVRDAVEDPGVTAFTMMRAVELASGLPASNILTSVGKAATQSVMHLHIHVVPRSVGDQLMVPWGTTGDPHEPHRCKEIDRLTAEVERLAVKRIV